VNFVVDNQVIDSVELKCLVISRGLKIDREVYQKCGKDYRIYPNALTCNSFKLPDGTIVMATDLGFHLSTLSSMFSWENLKLFKYMNDMTTDYRLLLVNGQPTLLYKGEVVTRVDLMPGTEFYDQKTSSGMPYAGNAVLQGCDWVAFQCLWPCDYACAGKPCQFCFSGGQFESLARRHKPMPFIPSPRDVSEVVLYAVAHDTVNSMQLTGGSAFRSETEEKYITAYMRDMLESGAREALKGELLLYITPPERHDVIDRYFDMGASRIACSLEVWDDKLGESITPGKRSFTTKRRHLDALTYIAEKYGPGKAFCNFIIGLEPFDTLKEGATYLAERGVIPSASVWMPFGKPVNGSMKPASLEYFRKTKDMLAELYLKYKLEPAGCCGLNVCVERDIWRQATGTSCC